MSIERFIKDYNGSNFISIIAGVNDYDIEQMSGDMKEHYIAIRFLDGAGNDVVPTSGDVEFQGSQFRKPLYDKIEGASFPATDVSNTTRMRPVVYGPMRACRLTLSNITGAVTCVAKITSF